VNAPSGNFRLIDFAPPQASFRDDVIRGLSADPKFLPSKYFYDDRGRQLFQAICDTPEYYPIRTELELIQSRSAAIAKRIGPKTLLIEYGGGNSPKTPVLIDALQPVGYVPIDMAREPLAHTALQLADRRPELPVRAVCADYTKPLELPNFDDLDFRRKLVYFPGSGIGNFDRDALHLFLQRVWEVMGPDGAALIGVDLKKDPAILDAAYNDASGLTAAFNLNILARINRELGGDCSLDSFRHHAFYDPVSGQVEMHLMSMIPQKLTIASRLFFFCEGETIRTQVSRKYSIEEFQATARRAGLVADGVWTDPNQLFSVHYLTAAGLDYRDADRAAHRMRAGPATKKRLEKTA
jgi:dimethylhistidine N-methyltransferase